MPRLVRLSKAFSFITAETAFIALPPDLQRQDGFSPQDQSAQQYYGGASAPPAAYPEPGTVALLVSGAVVLAWWRRRARRSRAAGLSA